MKQCKECCRDITEEETKLYNGYCKNCYKEFKEIETIQQKLKERSSNTQNDMKKSFILIFLICLIFIVCFSIKPIIKIIYEKQFIKNIEEYLYGTFNDITLIKFSDKYKLHIQITMNDDFTKLEFPEQEPVLIEISEKLEEYYISYRNNVNIIDDNINYNYGKIEFLIGDINYHTCLVSSTIHKNGVEYTLEKYYIEKLKNKLEQSNIDTFYRDFVLTYLNSISDNNIYIMLLEINDSNTLKLEIIYQYLLKLCENKEYNGSIIKWFQEDLINYKDSKKLIENMQQNEPIEPISQEKKAKEPYIGMTKTEAQNSTWGRPSKINKTTTAYRIHEQWVYGNGKYLYFDNGYLTSIQE